MSYLGSSVCVKLPEINFVCTQVLVPSSFSAVNLKMKISYWYKLKIIKKYYNHIHMY